MNVRLLGTGAADGIPTLFGNDPVSRHAREHGGKDIRSRSAALVDGVLKIDLPPDTWMQMQRCGLSGADWSALLFTHSDDDHFAPSEIQYALYPFTTNEHLPFTIYGNDVVCDKIKNRYPAWPLDLVRTRSFECFEHGPYRITPVSANHLEAEDCHNFLIEKGGSSLLYATDTGFWGDETFAFLKHFRLGALVIECTEGFDPTPYEGHMDIKECVELVERLRTDGVLDENSKVVTTHHSARGGARHCDLECALRPRAIEPGFDGMVIDF